MPKNIVVFCDGTGQEGGVDHDTNVYTLFKMVENRTDKQIAFYDRGLGTSGNGNFISRGLGAATGYGISQNIKECYQFIFENYQAGDKIYLFGFSRGAATVRSLSGFLHMFGILPKSRPELIETAYEIYKIGNAKQREAEAQSFRKQHHNMWCAVEFLGVWDTVAALGVPRQWLSAALNALPFFKHKFHDLTLSPSVRNAYHALSIDDERKVFHPTLWQEWDPINQSMEQVWFAGVHTDIGGGYKDQGLAHICLEWMISKAKGCGLRFYKQSTIKLSPNPQGKLHDSRATKWAKVLYPKKVRALPDWYDEPQIHESVFDRAEADPTYRPWILKGRSREKEQELLL
ncbi:DUF2235 domain-containing protein [Rhodobacteraceae bacterium RKSG542]|uniref:DUF2235 domain-containing protein n=1 Tax=Pseudovibrio flavus TaxID=2529854 RepID=UPI0012BB9518|nr:DUF2235 domain-containing protein [Pseudovibrio flavus]MTI16354.1 DUF2235 domain-containing protein [Pseudovibrio flavus]